MKGKYAAKAANRMAQLDDGIIDDLKAKLAEVTAERDEARREVATLRDRLATEVHRAARDLSEQRIDEVAADLVAERRARSEDRERLGELAFAVFEKHGTWPKPAMIADLASVFGLSRRVGEVIHSGKENRHARRTNVRKVRLIQASIDAGDRRI